MKAYRKQPPPLDRLLDQLKIARLGGEVPLWVLEYKFHPTRKWRSDIAFIGAQYRVLVEVHGGIFRVPNTRPCPVCGGQASGRHTRGKGLEGDAAKLNEALLLGYIPLTVTPGQIDSGEALGWIIAALKMILPARIHEMKRTLLRPHPKRGSDELHTDSVK